MKTNLSCSVAQDLLPQYAEGLLLPESEAELKAHLAQCPACRKICVEMTSPEPELLETVTEVDYLKKIRTSRLRLLICGLAAVVLVAAGALLFLQHQQKQATAKLTEQEQKTSELLAQIAQNAVSYDADTRTMVIYGNNTQGETVLPPALDEAVYLDAQFDSFHLSAYLPHLRGEDVTLETFLPQYLDRTENSFRFIRDYLKENCTDQYPARQAAKYVDLTIHQDEGYHWTETEDRIALEIGSFYWHREEVYILSLLGSERVQWKQLGYAWYLGTCVDPYSEVLVRTRFDLLQDYPYAEYYTRAGGTAENTPENNRKLVDAVSCVCLTKGMYWGSAYESVPLRMTALYQAAASEKDPGDEMSVCMATSFVAWLSDRYGFDRVSSFCFDQATFEEAFDTDYASAYKDWSDWILRTYAGQ